MAGRRNPDRPRLRRDALAAPAPAAVARRRPDCYDPTSASSTAPTGLGPTCVATTLRSSMPTPPGPIASSFRRDTPPTRWLAGWACRRRRSRSVRLAPGCRRGRRRRSRDTCCSWGRSTAQERRRAARRMNGCCLTAFARAWRSGAGRRKSRPRCRISCSPARPRLRRAWLDRLSICRSAACAHLGYVDAERRLLPTKPRGCSCAVTTKGSGCRFSSHGDGYGRRRRRSRRWSAAQD